MKLKEDDSIPPVVVKYPPDWNDADLFEHDNMPPGWG